MPKEQAGIESNPCFTGLSATHFRNAIEFPDATRAPDKPYAMLREGAFAQYGRIGPRGLRGPWGLHFTEDYGDDWRVVDIFPEDPASLPQFSGAPAMAYFALRTGVDAQGRATYRMRVVNGQLMSQSLESTTFFPNDVYRIQFSFKYSFN